MKLKIQSGKNVIGKNKSEHKVFFLAFSITFSSISCSSSSDWASWVLFRFVCTNMKKSNKHFHVQEHQCCEIKSFLFYISRLIFFFSLFFISRIILKQVNLHWKQKYSHWRSVVTVSFHLFFKELMTVCWNASHDDLTVPLQLAIYFIIKLKNKKFSSSE